MRHRHIPRQINGKLSGLLQWLCAIVVVATTIAAGAADRVWDNGAGNFLWGDPLNWDGDSTVPGPSDATFFGDVGVGTIGLGGVTRPADQVYFSNSTGTFTSDGGTLLANSVGMSGRPTFVNANVTAPGSLLIVQNDAADDGYYSTSPSPTQNWRLNVGGKVTAPTLVKTGVGRVLLSNASNDISQGVVVTRGTLEAFGRGSLGPNGQTPLTLTGGRLLLIDVLNDDSSPIFGYAAAWGNQ